MEIAVLSPTSLRIKGKQTTFVVDPQDKNLSYSASITLDASKSKDMTYIPDAVNIAAPGEYEIGGIKVSAYRYEEKLVYSLIVDGVSLLLADMKTFTSHHQKLREHNIVIIAVSGDED